MTSSTPSGRAGIPVEESGTSVTCFKAFRDSAARYADRSFLYIPARPGVAEHAVDYSYRRAAATIADLQRNYAGAGYGVGHRIALMLGNTSEFYLHFLALNGLGACVVPLQAELSVEEISYLVRQSEACCVVALPEYQAKADEVCGSLASRVPIVLVDQLAAIQNADVAATAQRPGGNAPAAILYTSGTTGRPKGCVLSNNYFLSWGRWYLELGGLATLRPGIERLITPLPTNHQNAMACSFMGMVMSGGCIIQLDRFHPKTWWQTVRETRATIMHYLGVMPAMLLNAPEQPCEIVGDQVRFGLGAGVDPKHHAPFEKRFGFPLLEGWAMTETGGNACIMSSQEPRQVGQRCIGKPPATLDYSIVDDHDRPVLAGEAGELLVRSSGHDPRRSFFSEYFKDPVSTDEAWRGGWFRTGDVVRADAAGYLYFVDRRKNVIRRSGENIAAIEVEGVLLQHDAVRACAVTAVPDDVRGEEVMALIQLADGHSPSEATAKAIQSRCLERLAYFKVPGYVGFVDALPVGATQKIKRAEIKVLADKTLEGGVQFNLIATKRRPRGAS